MRAGPVLTACAVIVMALAQVSAYGIRTAEDANIGAGLLLLVVLALGLPWSGVYFLADGETISVGQAALLAGCAIVNAGLVYLFVRVRSNRTQRNTL